MKRFKIFPIDLRYFDGEGATPGESGPGEAGEKLLSEAAARRPGANKKDAYKDVVYGKAPEGESKEPQAAAAQAESEKPAKNTLEEKRKAYEELIKGEYKEFYQRDTQNIVRQRFNETKALEKQIADSQPVIDMLMQRYGTKDLQSLQNAIESDSAYWQEAADNEGMTVQQYMEFQKLQRENRALLQQQEMAANQQRADQQLAQWTREAEALKAAYPEFNLEEEAQNDDFIRLLKAGTPMAHAYKVIHFDEIVGQERMATAAMTERQVVENIKAKGSRPSEAGLNSTNGITRKSDVDNLSKGDVLEIAKRVKRGETISF